MTDNARPNSTPSQEILAARYRLLVDGRRPDIDYQDKLAEGAIMLGLNALVIINAGALVALAPLKQFISSSYLWWAGGFYLAGLATALLAVGAQIWNARLISRVYRHELNIQLRNLLNACGYSPDNDPIFYSDAKMHASRQGLVEFTMLLGWSTAAASIAVFVVASIILFKGGLEPQSAISGSTAPSTGIAGKVLP